MVPLTAFWLKYSFCVSTIVFAFLYGNPLYLKTIYSIHFPGELGALLTYRIVGEVLIEAWSILK